VNGYGLLADLVVTVHLAFMLFIVLGQVLIVLGALLRWSWVRNPWFRLLHLLAIAYIASQALAGRWVWLQCPLTGWESDLRELADQPLDDATALGQVCHRALFYQFDPWVFVGIYATFGALVVASFVLVPPRFARRDRIAVPESVAAEIGTPTNGAVAPREGHVARPAGEH
jgi:hypothetical protein